LILLSKRLKFKMAQVKKEFELDVVNLIKKGLNPSKIAVHLNISLPSLSYYLSSLKRQGVIKKVGYGTWEVIPSGEVKISSHKGINQVKDVRGHGFIWKIKTNRKFDWESILKVPYETKGLMKVPRVIINNRKIWLGQKYITIFEPKFFSYFGTSTIDSKREGVLEMIKTIEELKRTLNIEFQYKFTCRRQHYGFIKNIEAKAFLREGKKLLIKDEKGYWFSIDNSQNTFEEAETIHEQTADIDGLGYQNLMNSHKRTNFKMTPEVTLDLINKVTANQLIFDNNMKSHLEVLDKLGKAVNELREEIRRNHAH